MITDFKNQLAGLHICSYQKSKLHVMKTIHYIHYVHIYTIISAYVYRSKAKIYFNTVQSLLEFKG